MANLTAIYVAVNAEALISESIRSVKAYVDRIVIVDSLFVPYPSEGTCSSDRQQEMATLAADGIELLYIASDVRLEEHAARNLALEQVALGDWALIIDSDECLYGDHDAILRRFASLHEPLGLRVFTSAVRIPKSAPDISPNEYATMPVINTVGYQPRVVQRVPGLQIRKERLPNGEYLHSRIWVGDTMLGTHPAEEPFIINHRLRRTHDEYQRTYSWEVAQGGIP